jgi:hypothetical protein
MHTSLLGVVKKPKGYSSVRELIADLTTSKSCTNRADMEEREADVIQRTHRNVRKVNSTFGIDLTPFWPLLNKGMGIVARLREG